MRTTKLIRYGVAALAMVASAGLAQNVVYNGGFDIPAAGLTPPNYPATYTGGGSGGLSSADGWTLWNSTSGTISTELLPTTDPLGAGYMMHLTVADYHDGVYQVFAAQAQEVNASVDVYVVSGFVEFGIYYGPTLEGVVTSSTLHQWQTLSLPGLSSANEITLYAATGAGSEFYVENASVTPVPEPTTISLWAAAAVLIPVFRRIRQQKG